MTTKLDVLRLEQNVRDAYERLAAAHIDMTRHLNKRGDGTDRELARAEAFMEAAKAEIQRAVTALACGVDELEPSSSTFAQPHPSTSTREPDSKGA